MSCLQALCQESHAREIDKKDIAGLSKSDTAGSFIPSGARWHFSASPVIINKQQKYPAKSFGSVRRGVFKALAQTGAAVISSFPSLVTCLSLFNLARTSQYSFECVFGVFFVVYWRTDPDPDCIIFLKAQYSFEKLLLA